MKPRSWLRWIAVIGFVALIGTAAVYSFSTARHFALTSPFEGLGAFSPTDPGAATQAAGPTEVSGAAGTESPSSGEGEGEIPESNWQGAERVTVLIMGLDYRDWEAGSEAPRTDTMILLTVDPVSNTAGMLSIPRDLYKAARIDGSRGRDGRAPTAPGSRTCRERRRRRRAGRP